MRTKIAFLMLMVSLIAGCDDEQPSNVEQAKFTISLDSIKSVSIEVSNIDADPDSIHHSYNNRKGVISYMRIFDKNKPTNKINDTTFIEYYKGSFGRGGGGSTSHNVIFVGNKFSIKNFRFIDEIINERISYGNGAPYYFHGFSKWENQFILTYPHFIEESGKLVFDVKGTELAKYLSFVDYRHLDYFNGQNYQGGPYINKNDTITISGYSINDSSRIRITLQP